MAIGRMSHYIDIITTEPVKDSEGFVNKGENILASVRAYMDERRGDEKQAGGATFSTAVVLFRFRKIPDVVIDTSLFVRCEGIKYRIISVESVKGRGLYVEILTERQEGTVR